MGITRREYFTARGSGETGKWEDTSTLKNRIDMSDRTDIKDSFYSDMFEDVGRGIIFQLSIQRSKEIWSEYIDKRANNYFHLANENWLISSQKKIIGSWIDDYNAMILDNVSENLSKAVPWANGDEIWFCVNKSTILECSWYVFKSHWNNFLCSHDDAPIIVHPNWKFCGMVFYVSDVVLIGDCAL